ncbi:MAG: elongation factor P [Phycisphaeraceae bacterium]|nr:elongation factor P [Phycisphaeraceae bacterium]
MKSQDLRPGIAIRMDGNLFVVTKAEHRTPGNLRAFMQVKIKNVKTGVSLEKRLGSGEEVEAVNLDRRELEYLYSDNTGAVFMDTTDFEQTALDPDVLGDSLLYLKPNTSVTGLVAEGKVVSIELPKVVELKLTETPPGIKGATATNQLKEAVCETGLKIRVPGFISQGETVRISTESGEYLSRAGD